MRWAFETYLPRVYVNFHTGAFMAHGTGNGDLGSAILSNAPEFDAFFSASAGSGSGGAGMAVADAADLSPGVSAWLIEFFGSSSSSPYGNAWRHEADHLDSLVNDYYPVIEEFFIAAAAEIE